MDDERLKNPPGKGQRDYFDELLERIRDIRASERRFYQKVLDIYATSVDYTPNAEMSQQFFATVQNKMHWAAHGHTAAEIIHERADATKPFMGLQTTRPGGIVRKEDVAIAKNYLTAGRASDALNRIVNALHRIRRAAGARAQADDDARLDHEARRVPRRSRVASCSITPGASRARTRKPKAELEYERYRALMDAEPRRVDADFEAVAKTIEKLPSPKPTKKKKKS